MKKLFAVLLAVLLAAACFSALADTYSEDGTTLYYDTAYVGKTADSGVVLRASAYSKGQIVDTLRKGIKLTITAAKYDTTGVLWYAAETKNHRSGWVMADQVAFADDVAVMTPGVGYGYIGNAATHVYHLPDCRVLPKPENQVLFTTAAEAAMSGFRPCSICKPY